jgi:recombination protein RecA
MVAKQIGPSGAALAKFEAAFSKSFGADTLRRSNKVEKYDVLSTGSLALDFAMGVGGYVKGRLVEIWGPESVGKTTLTLIGLAAAQRAERDKTVAFIDMEQTLDLDWAEKLGVDLSRLYHVQPDSAEEVADMLKAMTDSELISEIVVDSIGGMIPTEEMEKNAGDATVGTSAKIITRMVKIAAVQARQRGTVITIINQVRANLGYGADTTTGGGFALRHVTTHKLKCKRTGTGAYTVGTNDDKVQVGQEISIQVEKNKVAPPKKSATITIFNQETEKYGPIGIDHAFEAWTLGRRLGVIKTTGAWFTLPDESRHNGQAPVITHLRENPKVVAEIRKQVLATVTSEVVQDEVKEG